MRKHCTILFTILALAVLSLTAAAANNNMCNEPSYLMAMGLTDGCVTDHDWAQGYIAYANMGMASSSSSGATGMVVNNLCEDPAWLAAQGLVDGCVTDHDWAPGLHRLHEHGIGDIQHRRRDVSAEQLVRRPGLADGAGSG